MEVSIGTYNIHRCVGTDGRKDIERILCVLREMNADIIALQEVETRLGGRDNEDQATYLGEKLNMEVISGPTLRNADEHYGNALLVKHSIDTETHHDISLPGREPRATIDVTLDVDNGRFLRVLNTHLGLKRKERRQQIDKLISFLKSTPEKPLVLAGDFNSWLPFFGTIKKLDKVLGDSPLSTFPYLRTYPSFFPLLALDRMWISPPKITTKKWVHKTHLSRKASDHLPMIATLSL